MVHFYPSFQALTLAGQILDEIGKHAAGYQGRIGTAWYWKLPGGILVTFVLEYTTTEQRWNGLKAEAASPNVGIFNAANFPFEAYGTVASSPPFIHDLDGEAEWSNRLYFQMGHLIEDAALWLEMLRATIIDPQIRPPSAFPDLSPLERELVTYAVQELDGFFTIKALHQAFEKQISHRRLSELAKDWESFELLTHRPRRVTVALRALAGLTY